MEDTFKKLLNSITKAIESKKASASATGKLQLLKTESNILQAIALHEIAEQLENRNEIKRTGKR